MKVEAIETREWYFKCGGCTYARYTGQDEASAKAILATHEIHNNHHGGSIWYRRVETKRKAIQASFGRKVRDTMVAPNRIYPDEHYWEFKKPIEEVMLPNDPPF
jgi:hypothetical protein